MIIVAPLPERTPEQQRVLDEHAAAMAAQVQAETCVAPSGRGEKPYPGGAMHGPGNPSSLPHMGGTVVAAVHPLTELFAPYPVAE